MGLREQEFIICRFNARRNVGYVVYSANDAQGFGMMRNNAAPQIMEDPETGKNMKVDPCVAMQ